MIKIGVIRGGIGSQYENSLKTGENILSHLRHEKLSDKYKPIDILIDKNGDWHMNGLVVSFEKIFHGVDVIFNALHGDSARQNNFHQIFDQWKIPYTGSGAFVSAVVNNKILSKEHLYKLGVNIPKHILIPVFQKDFDGPKETYPMQKAEEIIRKLPPPYLVRPLDSKTSMGTHVCKTLIDLTHAIKDGVDHNTSLLIEEFIEGKKASVGVVANFRNQKIYTFPPEGDLSKTEKNEIEKLAKTIHSHFNLDHYSESSFMVKKFIQKKPSEIYITSVRHLPDLSKDSTMVKYLESVGSNMHEFIDHIISQARQES